MQRLTAVLLLNLALIAALVIVGLTAHSLAVFAAGADYLADAGAIGVSLLAIWLARQPPSRARPYGYPNATNIAAFVNAGWLLVLNFAIAVAAIQRLATGTRRLEGLPVLIASAVAAGVMIVGAVILARDPSDGNGGEELNVKAVLLDTTADAATAAGLAASGAVILIVGGWYWLDPAVALVIAVIVGYHAARLVRKAAAAIRHPEPARPPAR